MADKSVAIFANVRNKQWETVNVVASAIPPDTRLSDLLRKMGLDPNNVQVITASEFDRTDNVIPFPKSGSAQKQGVPVNAARVSFPNFPKRSTLSPSDHILNVLGLLAAADK